jgi:hypothetical protein
VDVAAVSGRVRPRLGSERRGEPARGGDAADRLSGEDLRVGREQRRSVSGGQLLLTRPELCVELVDHDPLLFERLDEHVDVLLGGRHPDGREAEARVDRSPFPFLHPGERELVLEPRAQECPAGVEGGLHPLQERSLAHRRRVAVETDLVGEDGSRARRVREDAERGRVGDDAQLAHRSHTLDGLEPVERVHRLHREGDADPAVQACLEPGERGRLGADGAVVAAPQEADEQQAALPRGSHDVHGGKIGPGGLRRRCR